MEFSYELDDISSIDLIDSIVVSPDAPSVCLTSKNYLYLDDLTRAITLREYNECVNTTYWNGNLPCLENVNVVK